MELAGFRLPPLPHPVRASSGWCSQYVPRRYSTRGFQYWLVWLIIGIVALIAVGAFLITGYNQMRKGQECLENLQEETVEALWGPGRALLKTC